MRKASDIFKQTIQKYLEQRAANDELFAQRLANPNKNIDDCITYILNCVEKSGCQGFADEEIYGMATHYYDEDNIEVGNPMIDYQIGVNHVVELTEEEKAEARKAAIQKYHDDELRKMQQRATKRAAVAQASTQAEQLNLFE